MFTKIKEYKHKKNKMFSYFAYTVISEWNKEKQQPRQRTSGKLGALISPTKLKKEQLYVLFRHGATCETCLAKEGLVFLQGRLMCAPCHQENNKPSETVVSLSDFERAAYQ